MMNFKIGSKTIGENQRVFIVAELSCNHLQKFDLAVATIKAIKKAGADAVKMQTFTPDSLTLNINNKYFKKFSYGLWKGMTPYELYQKAYMPWEWQPKLKKLAESLGLICFSAPFDHQAVNFLAKLKMPAYKVGSLEIVDTPLIKHMAKLGKPMIMSTGIATLGEIEEAINICKTTGNNKIALLKCNAAYPTPIEDLNLKIIQSLKKSFGTIVGLSDHSLTISAAIAAVVLGAKIIEKHFIIKKDMGGPDAAFSLEPKEFSLMVKSIREVEKSLGSSIYKLTGEAIKNRNSRRSLFVTENIKKGTLFNNENIRSLRPSAGLSPKYLNIVLGKKANINIKKGTPLNWTMVS